jgi:hypothetical protein
MNSHRRLAIAAGVFFLITHVTSVGARFLYGPILSDPDYIVGSGPDTQVQLGALFDVILAMANIGTGVALYPVVRRWNEAGALGYACLRTLEASIIAVGVVPLLAVVTVRQQLAGAAGADTATLVTLGSALVQFYEWTFLVGPGLVVPFHTVLMAFLLYRSRLVARFIPVLGLIGGPLVLAVNTALVFGIIEDLSGLVGALVIPIFAWEVSLALWLIVKGFNTSRVASLSAVTEISRGEASERAA